MKHERHRLSKIGREALVQVNMDRLKAVENGFAYLRQLDYYEDDPESVARFEDAVKVAKRAEARHKHSAELLIKNP